MGVGVLTPGESKLHMELLTPKTTTTDQTPDRPHEEFTRTAHIPRITSCILTAREAKENITKRITRKRKRLRYYPVFIKNTHV